MKHAHLSRREFIQLFGSGFAAGLLPKSWLNLILKHEQPTSIFSKLPNSVKDILTKIPSSVISEDGFLLIGPQTDEFFRVPVIPTEWNEDHRRLRDRLAPQFPWGIVLHWFGEPDGFSFGADGYLRGFNGVRKIDDYLTQTSAHFLVGNHAQKNESELDREPGIWQMQVPDKDGVPFLASHLKRLDYQLHRDHQHYFVKALYQLGYDEPKIKHLLQDLFDGAKIDPNLRTIAIEITGNDFELPGGFPDHQKTANVLAVIWAIMVRYQIPASSILGHNEIQIDKPDPGKQFAAYIRYFIGLLALTRAEANSLIDLVFGEFIDQGEGIETGVAKYFKFVRDYLVAVGTPQQVFGWEKRTQFWQVFEIITGGAVQKTSSIENLIHPFAGGGWLGDDFQNDIKNGQNPYFLKIYPWNIQQDKTEVRLVSAGKCLYKGKSSGCCLGYMVIFRHRLSSGAEILSLYDNLSDLSKSVAVGENYDEGISLGTIQARNSKSLPNLYFAMAYGATWDAYFRKGINLPEKPTQEWIKNHFISRLNRFMRFVSDDFAHDTDVLIEIR